jgi:hypothetical protein
MLVEDHFDVSERLKPMFMLSLERQSFMLRIVCTQFVVIPLIQTELGNRPAWGLYYQAEGKIPGRDHHVGNMTVTSNPTITQLELDEIVREGCESLRNQIKQQSFLHKPNGNGIIQS